MSNTAIPNILNNTNSIPFTPNNTNSIPFTQNNTSYIPFTPNNTSYTPFTQQQNTPPSSLNTTMTNPHKMRMSNLPNNNPAQNSSIPFHPPQPDPVSNDPAQNSPGVNLQFQNISPLLPNEIMVGGEKYRFNISQGGNTFQGQDWQGVATQVAEFFNAVTSKPTFEKAQIVLTGKLDNITVPDLQDTAVKIEKAKVKYKENVSDTNLTTKKFNRKNEDFAFKDLVSIAPEFSGKTAKSRANKLQNNGKRKKTQKGNRTQRIPAVKIVGESIDDKKGRCLDMALAYQILRKRHPDITDPQEYQQEMTQIADALRESAAHQLEHNRSTFDPHFYETLKQAIKSIPEYPYVFALNNASPNVQLNKNAKKRILSLYGEYNDRNDPKRACFLVKQALHREKKLSETDKSALCDFYRRYITQKDRNGAMNSLDGPFFLLLNQCETIPEFRNGINCFIRFEEDGTICSCSNSITELNTENWLFVNYKGKNGSPKDHYEAIVDKDSRHAIVEQMKHSRLVELYEKVPNTSISDEDVQNYLKNELYTTHPKGFFAIARLVYQYLLEKWRGKPERERGFEPGVYSPNSNDGNNRYDRNYYTANQKYRLGDDEQRGINLIMTQPPAKLRKILKSFNEDQIERALNEIQDIPNANL